MVGVGVMKGNGEVRILVTARKGALPRIFQYSPIGEEIGTNILAYPTTFRGGAYATYGDVDGDGVTEIITMPGPGMTPLMKRFTLSGIELTNTRYLKNFNDPKCGMYITAGDANNGIHHGDGLDEVYFARACRKIPGLDEFDPTYVYPSGEWYQSMLVDLFAGPTINLRRINGAWVTVVGHFAGRRSYIIYNFREDYLQGSYFYPFPDSWLGGATAAVVDRGADGIPEFIVVPGEPSLTVKELQKYSEDPFSTPLKKYSTKYIDQQVQTSVGTFRAKYIQINLRNPHIRISTAQQFSSGYGVTSLATLIQRQKGFAGINGGEMTCNSSHTKCGPSVSPWYDSLLRKFNPSGAGGGIQWVFDSSNRWYYFGASNPVGSYDGVWTGFDAFTRANGRKLTAAFGNVSESNPKVLLEDGLYAVGPGSSARARRSAFGVRGDEAFLLVMDNATSYETAVVLKTLGVNYATTLDGGGSSALYYQGHYKIGPGRNIGNAIVISER
jgi:hypothetical protein